jgi:hypothetical protein
MGSIPTKNSHYLPVPPEIPQALPTKNTQSFVLSALLFLPYCIVFSMSCTAGHSYTPKNVHHQASTGGELSGSVSVLFQLVSSHRHQYPVVCYKLKGEKKGKNPSVSYNFKVISLESQHWVGACQQNVKGSTFRVCIIRLMQQLKTSGIFLECSPATLNTSPHSSVHYICDVHRSAVMQPSRVGRFYNTF